MGKNTDKMEQLEQLKAQAQKVYENFEYQIRPKFPLVLVWVIPKAQRIGEIYVPDMQNKPVYEGLVLRTYNPFWKTIGKRWVNTEWEEQNIWVQPKVEVGDHVLFQHFVGIPIPRYDGGTGELRMVNEDEIVGVIEYQKESVEKKLERLISSGLEYGMGMDDSKTPEQIVKDILERCEVIFHTEPRTMSGV